jgi:hypothetical protein
MGIPQPPLTEGDSFLHKRVGPVLLAIALTLVGAFVGVCVATLIYFPEGVSARLLALLVVLPPLLVLAGLIRAWFCIPRGPSRKPIVVGSLLVAAAVVAFETPALLQSITTLIGQPGETAPSDSLSTASGWIWPIVGSVVGTSQAFVGVLVNRLPLTVLGALIALPAAITFCAGGVVALGVLPN